MHLLLGKCLWIFKMEWTNFSWFPNKASLTQSSILPWVNFKYHFFKFYLVVTVREWEKKSKTIISKALSKLNFINNTIQQHFLHYHHEIALKLVYANVRARMRIFVINMRHFEALRAKDKEREREKEFKTTKLQGYKVAAVSPFSHFLMCYIMILYFYGLLTTIENVM